VERQVARDEDHRAELADRPSEREARAGEEGRRDARQDHPAHHAGGRRAEGRRRLFGLAVELGEDGWTERTAKGSVTKASASRIPAGVPATLTPKGLLGP